MITPILYFLLLILTSIYSVFILDTYYPKHNKYKKYVEGILFGTIGLFFLYIHYYFIEHKALFPMINLLLSNFIFVSLSFFLFGLIPGIITLSMLLVGRIFLTEQFLFYSLVLLILTAANGYVFNKSYSINLLIK
jgi:hypothetical protein